MSIVIIAAIVVGLALLLVLGWAAAKPGVFRIARLVRIKAPPEAIYPHVVDLHRWAPWSPYEGIDADLKRSYEGAPSGVGAIYRWTGDKTGVGSMEIIEASAPRHIGIDLKFVKPFTAHNAAEFTFEPLNDPDLGHCTAVTWSMHGPAPFMSRLMGLFFNIDHMIGKDFEKGLLKLKALTEA